MKKAYGTHAPNQTGLRINTTYVAESLEQKIARILNNKEPITDSAPPVYTERKDGVLPAYNIRTDRFEIALEATDSIAKAHQAKREEFHKKLQEDNKNNKPEPTNPGTGDNPSDPKN